MGPSRARLYSLLLLMTFIWGINFVAAKIALRYMPALILAPLRIIVAALLLIPVFLWELKRRPGWDSLPSWREMPLLAAIGLLGVGLNQIAFMTGVQRTSVGHAALLIALTPMLVLLMAWFRGQEALSPGKILGMVTAVGGVVILNFGPGARLSGATVLGDALVFLAAFSFAFFAVASKEATALHGGLTVTTVSHIISGLCIIPFVIWISRGYDFAAVTPAGWAMLVYLAVFPSIVCYLIFYFALHFIPASEVASFSYLQPWIAALTGLWVLGEPLTGTLIAGGILILFGVFLAQRY